MENEGLEFNGSKVYLCPKDSVIRMNFYKYHMRELYKQESQIYHTIIVHECKKWEKIVLKSNEEDKSESTTDCNEKGVRKETLK